MSLPTEIGAYGDCLEYFDKACASREGIRLKFAEAGAAKYFQMRMTQARALHRAESRRIYPRDDPRWGKSEYDAFTARLPVEDVDGHWWVYVERHNTRVMVVEEIETDNARTQS